MMMILMKLGTSNLTRRAAGRTQSKNLDPMQTIFLMVAGEDSAPNSNFFKLLELSETCGVRVAG